MATLWTREASSIRDIQEAFPEQERRAYATIQTRVHRLEGKGAVRRVRKLGNFLIFEAIISRSEAQRRLIDDLVARFGGHAETVTAHLIESGRLTLEGLQKAKDTIRTPGGKANP